MDSNLAFNHLGRVAYGTTSLDVVTRGKIDRIVDDASDIAACGLAVATRFDRKHRDDSLGALCDCWRGFATPILGALPVRQQVECAFKLKAIQERNGERA
jgi:hypothetical protein